MEIRRLTWARRLLDRLPIRGDFAQNVMRLFAANAAAQLLTFAAYPILTRLYSPSQMGILSVVMFSMMVLQPASTLRYEIALASCASDAEAGSVVGLCFCAVLVSSMVLGLILLVLPLRALDALGPAAPYRLFLPLALLAFGAFNVLTYEASRVGRYSDLARTRVSQALVGPAIQIVLGICTASTLGLLTGFVIGLTSGTMALVRKLVLKVPPLFSGVSLQSIFNAAKKYRRFPLYSSWAGILLAGSSSLGNIAFTSFYGTAIGGYLFLSDRVLMQPLRVSGNALQQVYIAEAGKLLLQDPGKFPRLFTGVVWKQAAITATWLGAVFFGAAFALPLVFGQSWGPASQYIDVMLIGYLPTAIAIPVNHTLLLMGRQRLSAMLDSLRFAGLIVALMLARRSDVSPVAAVLLYSITQAAMQCVILGVIYLYVRRAAAIEIPNKAMAA